MENYFETEYNACGVERPAVITKYRNCKVLSILNGPFEPAGPIIDRFKGAVRVNVYSPQCGRNEGHSIQEHIEEMFSKIVILKEYPRSLLEIRVFVLEFSEDLLAACINSVSVLLLGAGISSNGVPFALPVKNGVNLCTFGYVSQGSCISRVLAVGNCESEEPPEKHRLDLLERMKYSLKSNYKEDWLGGI